MGDRQLLELTAQLVRRAPRFRPQQPLLYDLSRGSCHAAIVDVATLAAIFAAPLVLWSPDLPDLHVRFDRLRKRCELNLAAVPTCRCCSLQLQLKVVLKSEIKRSDF